MRLVGVVLWFAAARGFHVPRSGHLSRTTSSRQRSRSPPLKMAAFSNMNSKSSTVVVPRDYRLSLLVTAIGAGLDTVPYAQLTIGPLVTLIGILFFVQTIKLRFVVEGNTFKIQQVATGTTELMSSGENVIIGGKNQWRLDKFVNYDTFPEGWIDQPQGPVLIYFKETQTPKDTWTSNGVSKRANSPEAIKNGAKLGQPHFFPALCDAKILFSEFEKRGAKKLP